MSGENPSSEDDGETFGDRIQRLAETPECEKPDPHPEWTFETTAGTDWLHCPHCHSSSVRILMDTQDRDEDDAQGYESQERLWLKCGSCGETTLPRRGLPVEQPDGGEDPATARDYIEVAVGSVALLALGPLHFAGELVDPAGNVHWQSIILGTLGSLIWAAALIEVLLT